MKEKENKYLRCINYENECENTNICPCLNYEECDYYCHSCPQNFTEIKDGLYYHKCKLKEREK